MSSYKVTEFRFSASYVSGGESWDIKMLDHPGFAVLPFPKGGYVFEWDGAAKKIKAFYGDYSSVVDGVLVEVAPGVNVGAIGVVTVLLLPR